jgi:nitrite reductase/ring-hydroxylating ferredoxin subunit
MLSAEDNDLLTRTDAGTAMGTYFRRFWQPIALSEELFEPDGAPIRVTIMGEELVAFRNTDGDVGLIARHCPHRGADLFFGRNEECGLRCVYHGWKYDITGKAVELPNVPPGGRFHDSIRTTAYPAREFGDIVWAWLGPADKVPEIPNLEFGLLPGARRYVGKQLIECNWAQVMEGDLDTSHFSSLHMPAPSVPSNVNPDAPADERRLRWIRNDPMPKFEILDHDAGFIVGGARSADDEGIYWRMTQFMLPSHGTGPSTLPGETYFGFTAVPITDEASWLYVYAWNPERDIDAGERAKFKAGHGIIAKVDKNYVPFSNRSNEFMIDRQVQKTSSFTGVKGLAEQDLMIQQSQGFIVDRTKEKLAPTDAAVIKFRKVLLAAAKALASGSEPEQPWTPEAYQTRPGSWFADEGLGLEDVLLDRFGDKRGWVGDRG